MIVGAKLAFHNKVISCPLDLTEDFHDGRQRRNTLVTHKSSRITHTFCDNVPANPNQCTESVAKQGKLISCGLGFVFVYVLHQSIVG